MPDIVLTTLNARYIHTSLGVRYLYANLHELEHRATIKEYTILDRSTDIVEQLLALRPQIIGIGVYIWNVRETEHLIRLLKTVSPQTILILGGPEVSHQPFRMNTASADYIIQGEGEAGFYDLCSALLKGRQPSGKIHFSPPADLTELRLPYDAYSDEDIQNKIAYVEASRGCPFSCEFCLSSQNKTVRYVELDLFLQALATLWQRGARNYKFIDRTFNIQGETARRIVDFFLEKNPPFLVHFEVVPDHFPQSLKERLSLFQPGTLQLEIGIQTLQPAVSAAINRHLHVDNIKENLRFLESETHAHLHVDLIIGLPGEKKEQFADNLNQLARLTRAEIQLGILKKLSGTTINRHDKAHGMTYSPLPPYEILANNDIDFSTMQELKRFSRFWDIFYNSGNFLQSVRLLWKNSDTFSGFMQFSRWLYSKTGATWQISLKRQAELLFIYLTEMKNYTPAKVADSIASDLNRIPGRTVPPLIKKIMTPGLTIVRTAAPKSIGSRQARHMRVS